MGDKGARQGAAGADMAERLTTDLAPLGSVTSKKMFGGHGIFDDGVIFALVDSAGVPFFRADDDSVQKHGAAGSEAHGRMPYWSVPETILDDHDRLIGWAREARDMAKAAKGAS